MAARGRKAGMTDTRERILAAAITQFREKGFEETTMRGIAASAAVSLGNAYYYFPSKEHMILGFYNELLQEQQFKATSVIERREPLKEKLIALIRSNMMTIEPHRDLFISLFKCAADPVSPLNPFSEQSTPIRNASIALFEQALTRANVSVASDLKPVLPGMLWMYYMGIILFWIQDRSFGRRRTNRLLEISSAIVATLIAISSSPLFFEVRKQLLIIWREVIEDQQP